jgi:hypothetical protein
MGPEFRDALEWCVVSAAPVFAAGLSLSSP